MRWLFIFLSLLGYITSASASSLTPHISAEPERSFKTSGIYWLPDYLQDNLDRNARLSDDDGGKDVDRTCAKYNSSWVTTIGADMECDAVKPLPNLTCYKNCRCKNVVSVGTGEQCNRYCLSTQCVSKSCKAGVSVGSGETCTEKCASNNNICTAKRCAATVSVGTGEQCTATCGGNCVVKSCKTGVSVATGETCTERCASNSGICTAKSCNATVSVGVGEQCTTTCGGNCVAKSCKGSVSVGTGETCTQKCASNSGVCTAKSCKSTATVNTGEYCTERCAADNSCTAKACKGAVSVGVGESCSEYCSSNSSTCTAKKCNSAVGVNSSTEVCTQTCASDASVCTAKRAKTCAERSMKDCNGSCIATSECCGGCPTGQKCSNGTCTKRATCKSEIEANGGKLIAREADLISYGPTGGNLYVSDLVNVSSEVTLKNVTIKDAADFSSLCDSGSLKLVNVIADGTIILNIPFTADKISSLGTTKEGFQLETNSELSINNVFLNGGSKNSLNLSKATSVTIRQINTETYINSPDLNLEIRGNTRKRPDIGPISINGRSYLKLYSNLNICSINLSNLENLAKGPTVTFQTGSNVIAQCVRYTYEPFISMSSCGIVNKKCSVYFSTGNAGATSCTVNFNNRSLTVNDAVASAYVVGTVENVSSWGIGSAYDSRYATEFFTTVNGRLQFTDKSAISGGSMCEFHLIYDRYGYSSISNSSQIKGKESGRCNITSR